MNRETWSLIEQRYHRYPSGRAKSVDASEFDTSFAGFPVVADYREFVLRYGGGFVGTYPIYGLRLAEDMGTFGRRNTAPDITNVFRDRKWPAVEDWLVFSTDGFGNPVGLTADGSIWISDGPRQQIQKLSESFEDFLLQWALKASPIKAPT